MFFKILADLVVIIHFVFILYVIFGGLIVLKYRKTVFLHIPCAIWGCLIMFAGWICPLTYIENDLREAAGTETYSDGFIQHYIIPIIYPENLTRELQAILGFSVLVLNIIVYSILIKRLSTKG
ncbi:MAG: DUF2784 domain-containing protein [Brumimicrobium sp.]|nr:DUF2784 domain-containing protein [Brumimicrobium sp.]